MQESLASENLFWLVKSNLSLATWLLSCKVSLEPWYDQSLFSHWFPRLQVVSNFGDGNCGADEIHTRARNFEETRREGSAEN